MKSAKKVLNELLVDVFNKINILEYNNIKNSHLDISLSEIHVLSTIQGIKDATMASVANKLLVTPGTLSVSVKKLVEKGYIDKVVCEKDRRVTYLMLTEKSIIPLKIHDEFHERMINEVIKDMNISEDSELIKALENLTVYFENIRTSSK